MGTKPLSELDMESVIEIENSMTGQQAAIDEIQREAIILKGRTPTTLLNKYQIINAQNTMRIYNEYKSFFKSIFKAVVSENVTLVAQLKKQCKDKLRHMLLDNSEQSIAHHSAIIFLSSALHQMKDTSIPATDEERSRYFEAIFGIKMNERDEVMSLFLIKSPSRSDLDT